MCLASATAIAANTPSPTAEMSRDETATTVADGTDRTGLKIAIVITSRKPAPDGNGIARNPADHASAVPPRARRNEGPIGGRAGLL